MHTYKLGFLNNVIKLWKFLFLQFKLEETSAASSTSTQQPTSPTNGLTQDPLKTANISSVHRKQNTTENVPSNDLKEAPTTPNRSDDDKGKINYMRKYYVVH